MQNKGRCGDGPDAAPLSEPAAAIMPDFFERVPTSWPHLFIGYIPRTSRLALFQSSRQLARHVVQSARKVALYLGNGQPGTMETRRRAITSLLNEGRDIALHVTLGCLQPYPTALCAHVKDLWLHRASPSESTSHEMAAGVQGAQISTCKRSVACNFSYRHFPNVYSLALSGVDAEIHSVCDAALSGHLQAVRRVKIHYNTWAPPTRRRLIQTFGPQLTQLNCCNDFLKDVEIIQLAKPDRLELECCDVTSEDIKTLCQHTTLRHVILDSVFMAEPPMQGCMQHPRWGVLQLENMFCKALNAISLVHVEQVVIRPEVHTSDELIVSSVLASQISKLVLEPGYCKDFRIETLTALSLPCVRCLKSTCLVLILGEVKHQSLIPALWSILPHHVHTIGFEAARGVDWSNLWEGFPSFVSKLLFKQGVKSASPELLASLQATAPTHVQVLQIEASCWFKFLYDLAMEQTGPR